MASAKDPWSPYDTITNMELVKSRSKVKNLNNATRSDVLRSMVVDYLRGSKSTPSEYYAIVKKLVDYNSPDITSTDPFHELDVERARMLKGGVVDEFKKKRIAYVEVPSIFTAVDIEGLEDYQTLLRVDVTNAEKAGKRHVQKNEIIIISFADNKNLLYPTFKKYPKEQPIKIDLKEVKKESTKDKHKKAAKGNDGDC